MTRAPWVMAKPGHAVGEAGRGGRHRARLAVRQPPHARRRRRPRDDHPGRDRRGGRRCSTASPARSSDVFALRSQERAAAAQRTAASTPRSCRCRCQGRAADPRREPARRHDAREARPRLQARRSAQDGIVTAGTPRPCPTAPPPSSSRARRRSSGTASTPGRASSRRAARGCRRTSWASARCRRRRRRSAGAGWSSATSTRSSSTRPSPRRSLACVRRLGLDEEIVNADGGAIALGHPLGLERLPAGRHAARPARARGRAPRPRDAVRRRRPGRRACWSSGSDRMPPAVTAVHDLDLAAGSLRPGRPCAEVASEEADGTPPRRAGAPYTPATRFGIASGTKGLTALTVVSLVGRGTLELSTDRAVAAWRDLPLIDDASPSSTCWRTAPGIGDYLDEDAVDAITDYVMPVPGARLASTEDTSGPRRPSTGSPPGERFAYNNGGYVVLALLAERAPAWRFHEPVRSLSASPAGWPTPRSCAPTSCRPAPPRLPDATGRGRTCCTCRCAAAATAGVHHRRRRTPASGHAVTPGA